MDTESETILLAALLHDIGKFWQRTGEPHDPADRDLTRDDYGPTGAHAKWSAGFIRTHVPQPWKEAAGIALYHHKPIDRATKLVALADRLAAGERDEGREGEGEAPPLLRPVFGRLFAGETPATPDGPFTYPLTPLRMAREVLFPRRSTPAKDEIGDAYRRLWRAFCDEHARIARDAGGAFDTYALRLQYLLQRFTWCVPSAYYRQSYPDVSLFDHLRVTAAIAHCLLADARDEAWLDWALAGLRGAAAADARADSVALLLGGDVSGVQRFLYTITSRGAVAGLRGRSFYLDLLTDAITRFLLRELELTPLSILYVGGARLYVLAPLKAKDGLVRLRDQIGDALFNNHGVDLALALEWQPLRLADFRLPDSEQAPGFSRAWTDLSRRLSAEKVAVAARVARRAKYLEVFGPQGGGPAQTEVRCDVCARVASDEETFTLEAGVLRCEQCRDEAPPADRVPARTCDVCHEECKDGEARGQTLKCVRCVGYEELGRRLAHHARDGYLCIFGTRPPDRGLPGWSPLLAGALGVWYALQRQPEGEAYRLNDTRFAAAGAAGFRFTAAVTPWDEGGRDVKDFAALANDAEGIERLGVLRMDVDNLGTLFAQGLGRHATASRVSTLSFFLRLFFEGWLNEICRAVEGDPALRAAAQKSNLLYSIYSGGDDVFIVGAWDRLPLLAQRISEDLSAFAAPTTHLHASAGIAVVPADYPLYRSAEDAHQALDAAKRVRRPSGETKRALAFLNHTLGWEDMPTVREAVTLVWDLLRPNASGAAPGPRALLHVCSEVAEAYQAAIEDAQRRGRTVPGKVVLGRWLWIQVYALSRLAERVERHDRAAADKLIDLQRRLIDEERPLIPHLGLVARWVELLLRKRTGEEQPSMP